MIYIFFFLKVKQIIQSINTFLISNDIILIIIIYNIQSKLHNYSMRYQNIKYKFMIDISFMWIPTLCQYYMADNKLLIKEIIYYQHFVSVNINTVNV